MSEFLLEAGMCADTRVCKRFQSKSKSDEKDVMTDAIRSFWNELDRGWKRVALYEDGKPYLYWDLYCMCGDTKCVVNCHLNKKQTRQEV